MMVDIIRAVLASLIIAVSNPSRGLQRGSSADFIAAASERGKELIAALHNYSYYSEITIESVSQADTITGKYYRFSQVSFDDHGNPQERVLEAISTLPADVRIGAATANKLISVYQFLLTPETLSKYELNYIGRERVDDLDTAVFDVKPRIRLQDAEKDERYLKGRIWIDEQDRCVVKVSGQAVPERGSVRAPKFETYFQNYDKFWFPAYSKADDTIKTGSYYTRIVVNVRFTGYKKTTPR
jgi:hypothetical protein